MSREIMEELGIRLEKPALVTNFVDPEDQGERYLFKMVLDIDIKTLRSQQQEGDDLRYFSFEEIKRLPIMTDARLEILSNFFSSGRIKSEK